MGSKKEETKERIIEAAIKLISLNGFNATTTALIAKEVGLSETIIFKYFRDKKNLLREIGNLAIEQIFANIALIPLVENIEVNKDYPLRDFLKSIMIERLEFVEKNYELIKLLLFEMQYDEGLFETAREIIYPKIVDITDNIKRRISIKMQIPEEETTAVFRMILGAFFSLVVQKYFVGVEFKPGEIEAEIDNILTLAEKICEKEGN